MKITIALSELAPPITCEEGYTWAQTLAVDGVITLDWTIETQVRLLRDNAVFATWAAWHFGARWTLNQADLSGADLSGASLSKAYLRKADLRGAVSKAYLRKADLRGADLSGADLSGAYLSEAYLSGVIGLGNYCLHSRSSVGGVGRAGDT